MCAHPLLQMTGHHSNGEPSGFVQSPEMRPPEKFMVYDPYVRNYYRSTSQRGHYVRTAATAKASL